MSDRALHSQPNVAHEILAKLAVPGLLQGVAPMAQSFHLITQNVDRLSVIAAENLGESLKAQNLTGPEYRPRKGSIIQMHGKLFEVQCTECEWRNEDFSDPLCPALGEAEKKFSSIQDAGSMDLAIPLDRLPRCGKCQALARPGVVWFEERPYHVDEINNLVFKADMCLVIGTSSTVGRLLFLSFRRL